MAKHPTALLVFGGKKYVIDMLLKLITTAPAVTIKRGEIELNPDPDHVAVYPENTAWNEGRDGKKTPLAFYKFEGKYVVLHGVLPEKGDQIAGRLMTKHILKRAEYVSEEERARLHAQQPQPEERPFSNPNYRPTTNRYGGPSDRPRNPVFQPGFRKP